MQPLDRRHRLRLRIILIERNDAVVAVNVNLVRAIVRSSDPGVDYGAGTDVEKFQNNVELIAVAIEIGSRLREAARANRKTIASFGSKKVYDSTHQPTGFSGAKRERARCIGRAGVGHHVSCGVENLKNVIA